MKHWHTALTAGRELLAKVNIKLTFFTKRASHHLFLLFLWCSPQKWIAVNSTYILKIEKNLNHILFMNGLKLFGENEKEENGLVLTVQIFSLDAGITKFGIKNWGVLIMKRGKFVSSERLDFFFFLQNICYKGTNKQNI